MKSRDHPVGFVGVDVSAQAWATEDRSKLVYLRLRGDEFNVAPKPRPVQLIRRCALGDERADEDVRVKDDSHARRRPRRRSGA